QREGREANAVSVKTKDGRQIHGLRKNEDTFTLQVMEMTGDFHLLQKRDLVEVKHEDKSLMPDDYGKQFSAEELQSLLEDIAGPRSGQGRSRTARRQTDLRSHPAFLARTAQLAHLLWRLSRPTLLRTDRNHSCQCQWAAGSLGLSGTPGGQSPGDAPRRRWHYVHHPICRELCCRARCSIRASFVGAPPTRCRPGKSRRWGTGRARLFHVR